MGAERPLDLLRNTSTYIWPARSPQRMTEVAFFTISKKPNNCLWKNPTFSWLPKSMLIVEKIINCFSICLLNLLIINSYQKPSLYFKEFKTGLASLPGVRCELWIVSPLLPTRIFIIFLFRGRLLGDWKCKQCLRSNQIFNWVLF